MSFMFLCHQDLLSQETDSPDSLSLKITYDIKILQLDLTWPQVIHLPVFSEIVELKLYADEAEKSGDYSLALIYLDEIFSIIQENQVKIEAFEEVPGSSLPTNKSETIFEKELLTGMDFSRQEYHLTFSSQDSAYIETINNPYGGLKIRWNQYSPNEYDIELGGMFKLSRDYTIWQLNSRFEKSNIYGLKIQFNQHGEGMKYSRYFPVEYWQSLSDIRVEKRIGRYLSIQFDDEFQYRNYNQESEIFTTYWRNEYQFLLRTSNFWNSRFIFSYDYDQRRQQTYTLYDYDDQRINFQHYFNPSWRTSFSGWYQYRKMNYPQFVSDSSFVADYTQHFLSLNIKQNIQERISFRLFSESYIRNYPENSIYWSDYRYLRAEPGVRIEVSEKLTLGVDYLFEIKKYNQDENAFSDWFLNEDFSSEGIILSIDFFDFKKLLLSLNHTFRLNTYPNAPENTFPGLSLYTDRKQNSTMLFLSYQVFPGLDVSLLLQHDLDKDQEISNNDSQSSIFTLDFLWSL
jgi:hypothetical protein